MTKPDEPLEKWSYTEPRAGNKWQHLAKGKWVFAFPIWLYCDDTSGNLSIKWNKHNSILFTAAGLPNNYADLEYNVHFLATSNIADPLEMFGAIKEQLDQGQQNGIWAWDCVFGDKVLIIPSIFAFL